MKNFTILLMSLMLLSCCPNDGCDKEETEKTVTENSTPSPRNAEVEKPYSNPAIIYGSDFGHFFQEMYKLGNYEGMIAFTSDESVELHGEDVLIDYYKNMNFGFNLGNLKSISEDEDGDITMFYLSDIDATKVRTILHTRIENDSCKMVIYQDLDNFPLKISS